MKSARVLIIIVTWNKENYVMNLLQSIKTLIYDKQHINILLVDNASTDATVATVSKEYPDVTILCNEENLGGTGGFNTGLQWAADQSDGKYDYLWLLDNDVLVNRYALTELVELLEKNRDAAIAGASMMQLDYPWRINEIGSYYSRQKGTLIFNFHCVTVDRWKGCPIEDLLDAPCDLSDFIPDFKSYIDVDYVAAAALLVRADVAKKAGLWSDFFIHFDDVEWCLRIASMGYRVLVSCRALIWHVSAAAKIPTWVLYYDSRNALEVMKKYGKHKTALDRAFNVELKRAFYYALIGRMELARILIDAVDDFSNGIGGKKDIQLPPMFNHLEQDQSELPFMNPQVKKILVPWSVNMYVSGLQEILVRTAMQRPELQIDFLTVPGGFAVYHFPKANFIQIPAKRLSRYLVYLQLRNKYNLILQSEYERIIGLSWLGGRLMFLSNNSYCIRDSPNFREIVSFYFKEILQRWKMKGIAGKIRALLALFILPPK